MRGNHFHSVYAQNPNSPIEYWTPKGWPTLDEDNAIVSALATEDNMITDDDYISQSA